MDITPPAAADVTPATQGDSASFSFSAAEGTFACRLVGPARDEAFAPCSSPTSYSGLPAGDYTFTVRTTDAAGNFTDAAPQRFTVAAVAAQTPTPTPDAQRRHRPQRRRRASKVVVRPVSGKILVKRPGSTEYVELDETTGIPARVLGRRASREDHADLPAHARAARCSGRPSTAASSCSPRRAGSSISSSPRTRAVLRSGRKASAAKKPKSRKLWGEGQGRVPHHRPYSAATVRGTTWLVQDSCAGTLTRVRVGVVAVRDNVKKKTVLVRKGKRYLARPRR